MLTGYRFFVVWLNMPSWMRFFLFVLSRNWQSFIFAREVISNFVILTVIYFIHPLQYLNILKMIQMIISPFCLNIDLTAVTAERFILWSVSLPMAPSFVPGHRNSLATVIAQHWILHTPKRWFRPVLRNFINLGLRRTIISPNMVKPSYNIIC